MMRRMDEVQFGAWLTAAAASAGGGFLGYAVRGRSSAFFAPSMYRGDRSRPALALHLSTTAPAESTSGPCSKS